MDEMCEVVLRIFFIRFQQKLYDVSEFLSGARQVHAGLVIGVSSLCEQVTTGNGKEVAFPRAKTRSCHMCAVVSERLPYLTFNEKQIMEVTQTLLQIISNTVTCSV